MDVDSTALERCKAEGFVTRVLSSNRLKLKDEPEICGAEAAGGLPPDAKRARLAPEDCVSSHLAAVLCEFEAGLLVILDDVDVAVLNKEFRSRWCEKTFVVHSSLLPAFPGVVDQNSVIEAGVLISGCTVHFLSEHGKTE